MTDNHTIDSAAFDHAARRCYQQASDALPPRLRFQLRPHIPSTQPRAPWFMQRRSTLATAGAAFAIAMLAVGLGWFHAQPPATQQPTLIAATNTPQTVSALDTVASAFSENAPVTSLDADPDFFAWLASVEAQQLIVE